MFARFFTKEVICLLIIIKANLMPEKRTREALLLKQRWLLIQSGISRKNIKIRGNKLYVNNYTYDQIINSEYCVSPFSDDDAPAIKTSSDPVIIALLLLLLLKWQKIIHMLNF